MAIVYYMRQRTIPMVAVVCTRFYAGSSAD